MWPARTEVASFNPMQYQFLIAIDDFSHATIHGLEESWKSQGAVNKDENYQE